VPRAEPPSRGGNRDYQVNGKAYRVMAASRGYRERGIASWYGAKFHGRLTANGEVYDMYGMTAAHRGLPLPTYVEVRELQGGRSVVVRVNDRGPFHGDRIIDLSYAAAHKLGIIGRGTAEVEVRAIDPNGPVVAGTDAAGEMAVEVTATGVAIGRASLLAQPDLAAPILLPVSSMPAAAPAPRPDEAGLYLQVGAFASRENAERLRERLIEAVMPALVQAGDDPQRPVYRVRVGPLASAEEADRLSGRLVELGIASPRVVND
jgi:rare lipoprotein A